MEPENGLLRKICHHFDNTRAYLPYRLLVVLYKLKNIVSL